MALEYKYDLAIAQVECGHSPERSQGNIKGSFHFIRQEQANVLFLLGPLPGGQVLVKKIYRYLFIYDLHFLVKVTEVECSPEDGVFYGKQFQRAPEPVDIKPGEQPLVHHLVMVHTAVPVDHGAEYHSFLDVAHGIYVLHVPGIIKPGEDVFFERADLLPDPGFFLLPGQLQLLPVVLVSEEVCQQRLNSRMPVYIGHRDVKGQLFSDSRKHPQYFDGIAAEVKKIVIDAHSFLTKYVLP